MSPPVLIWAPLQALVVVGVERQGYRLSHITSTSGGRRSLAQPMWAAAGVGVAATPWVATQRAAWAAVKVMSRPL